MLSWRGAEEGEPDSDSEVTSDRLAVPSQGSEPVFLGQGENCVGADLAAEDRDGVREGCRRKEDTAETRDPVFLVQHPCHLFAHLQSLGHSLEILSRDREDESEVGVTSVIDLAVEFGFVMREQALDRGSRWLCLGGNRRICCYPLLGERG
jgi:hypothetical protein